MSDGNTMIDNVMAGHELGQDVDYDEEYIIAEDHAMVQAEEKMMKQEEGTSEDDESLERHILTTALVKSVVETSKKKPDEEASADDVQRYSLRKRRRPTGEDLEKLEEAQTAKRKAAQHAPENPSSETTRNVPPTAAPDPARNTNTSVPTAHAQLKTEAVPAVTVAAPASFTAPIPSASSLPPALQPPPRQTLSPKPSATSIGSRAKSPAKSKQQQRLAPAARIPAPKAPLEPDTAICGVPNPLSSPFPMSTGATTATNAATNGQSSHQTFKAGARLTVPCPLPASTFEKSVKQSKSQKPQTKVANATTVPAPAPELEKKKTVTISTDLPVQSRGRIFSIDLDRKCALLRYFL